LCSACAALIHIRRAAIQTNNHFDIWTGAGEGKILANIKSSLVQCLTCIFLNRTIGTEIKFTKVYSKTFKFPVLQEYQVVLQEYQVVIILFFSLFLHWALYSTNLHVAIYKENTHMQRKRGPELTEMAGTSLRELSDLVTNT
jgi:hypothetical protein